MRAENDVQQEEDREPPEIRRAKFVLFLAVVSLLLAACLVMLLFFQPSGQVLIERWPNGYPRTETQSIAGSRNEPLAHGRYRAWHEDGRLAEEGEFVHGIKEGVWRVWNLAGELDLELSGIYRAGIRERTLAPEER